MPDYARGAAILCQKPKFWQFINEEYNEELCKHPNQAAEYLRASIGIASRRELNTDHNAAEKYKQLLSDFNNWLNGNLGGQQKREPYRNKKLLAAANGQKCVRCNACDGTVVAAHIQGELAHLFGKGMSQKPDDYAIAFLCGECHGIMDQYRNGNNPEYTAEWLKLIVLTQAVLFRSGIVTAS